MFPLTEQIELTEQISKLGSKAKIWGPKGVTLMRPKLWKSFLGLFVLYAYLEVPCLVTRPYTRHKSRGLGRSGNLEGRGSGGCRIHDSISHVWLGRSGDAETAHKAPKTPKKQMVYRRTDGQTDGWTDRLMDGLTQWLIESRSPRLEIHPMQKSASF